MGGSSEERAACGFRARTTPCLLGFAGRTPAASSAPHPETFFKTSLHPGSHGQRAGGGFRGVWKAQAPRHRPQSPWERSGPPSSPAPPGSLRRREHSALAQLAAFSLRGTPFVVCPVNPGRSSNIAFLSEPSRPLRRTVLFLFPEHLPTRPASRGREAGGGALCAVRWGWRSPRCGRQVLSELDGLGLGSGVRASP